eukprot:118675-Alexandrium_andersonii.AAC.1
MRPPSWARCWTEHPRTTSGSGTRCTTRRRDFWRAWATSLLQGWVHSRLRSASGVGWAAR